MCLRLGRQPCLTVVTSLMMVELKALKSIMKQMSDFATFLPNLNKVISFLIITVFLLKKIKKGITQMKGNVLNLHHFDGPLEVINCQIKNNMAPKNTNL